MTKDPKDLIRIGTVSHPGDDSLRAPVQQIFYGKNRNSTGWMPYGFHSIAPEETLCIILTPNANSEDSIHLPTSMLDRPKGKPGEVFIFHPITGSVIKLASDGTIEVTAPTVRINADDIQLNGDTVIDGTLDVTGDIDSDATITGATDVIGNTISLKTHGTDFTAPDGPTGGPN